MQVFRFVVFLLLSMMFLECECCAQVCCAECNAGQGFYKNREESKEMIPTVKEIERRNANGDVVKEKVYAVLLKERLWLNGSTLDVVFWEPFPSVEIHDQIEGYIREWEALSNLSIRVFDTKDDFARRGDGNAEIRVTFSKKGHYSWIGTGSVYSRLQNEESMNLEFTVNTDASEVRRTTLHEFGHALGFKHEHQNPVGGIRWKQPDALEYYKNRTGWDDAKIRRNIFDTLDQAAIVGGTFDEQSIMAYSVPERITLNNVEIGNNTRLSEGDKKWVQVVYPFIFLDKLGIEVRVVSGSSGRGGIEIANVLDHSRCLRLSDRRVPNLFQLEKGDRVVSIGNNRIETIDDAIAANDAIDNHFKVVVENVRNGELLPLYSTDAIAPSDQAPKLGLDGDDTVNDGFVITKVFANMPAVNAGLEIGDTVWAVNGQRVNSGQEISQILTTLAGQGVFHVDLDVLNVRKRHLPRDQQHESIHIHF